VSIQSKQDPELQDCGDIGHDVKRVTETHDVSKLTKGHNSNKVAMTEEQACESTASKLEALKMRNFAKFRICRRALFSL